MDETKIMLSVVVCSYNRSFLIKETLVSIFEQATNFTMEIIVSDDCSTDNTIQILEELREEHPTLRINVTPENYGLGGNWASAMKLVRGKYVAFLDDDDLWTDENRMQNMVSYLEEHPSIDIVYTDGYYFQKDMMKGRNIIWPRDRFPELHKIWRGEQPCISLDMMVVRTATLNKCICYDDYIRLRFPIQDWCTNVLLLFHKARFTFLDYPSVAVRQTARSLSRTVDYDKIVHKAQQEAVMNCYIDQLITGDNTISYGIDEQRMYQSLTNAAYQSGDWKRAKEFSTLSGGKTLRNRCSKTWVTFSLYRLFRAIRRNVSCQISHRNS